MSGACDDPTREWSQEVAAESTAEEDVHSLGDVPDEEKENLGINFDNDGEFWMSYKVDRQQ